MLNLPRYDDGTLMSFTMPGGYPIYYVCKDNSVLCPDCANRQEKENADPERIAERLDDRTGKSWLLDSETIITCDINYEDPWLMCDGCSNPIECA